MITMYEHYDETLTLIKNYKESVSIDSFPKNMVGSLADGVPGYCLLLLNLYDNLRDDSLLLETEKTITNYINDPSYFNNTHSFFGGLIGAGIVYYELNKFNPNFKNKILKINEIIIKKINLYLDFVESQFKDNLQVEHYDLFFGVTGCLRYLLLFHEDKNMYDIIINRCINYLDRVIDVLLFRIDKIENHGINTFKTDISMGLSHGVAGILSALVTAYTVDTKYSYVLQTIRKINSYYDDFRIQSNYDHFKWKTLYQKGGKEYGVRSDDMSWCYGLTGVSRASIISKEILSLDNEVDQLEENYLKAVRHSLENFDNKLMENPSLCHGVSGVLYETFLIERKRPSDNQLTSLLLDRLLKILELDSYEIKYQGEYKNSFLNGFAGAYIVLLSVINDKPFIGDFSLLKS